jgi:hypothetical protein
VFTCVADNLPILFKALFRSFLTSSWFDWKYSVTKLNCHLKWIELLPYSFWIFPPSMLQKVKKIQPRCLSFFGKISLRPYNILFLLCLILGITLSCPYIKSNFFKKISTGQLWQCLPKLFNYIFYFFKKIKLIFLIYWC